TEIGVLLRADLETFQLQGQDMLAFLSALVPLLDGTHDKAEVIKALTMYSRQSVLSFLDLLEQYELVEVVDNDHDSAEQARWWGQTEFFRNWLPHSQEVVERLRKAKVLIVGLESWGVMAASELAAAGMGALHIVDDAMVEPDDLLTGGLWGT